MPLGQRGDEHRRAHRSTRAERHLVDLRAPSAHELVGDLERRPPVRLREPEAVLAALGRRPATSGIDLAAAGVEAGEEIAVGHVLGDDGLVEVGSAGHAREREVHGLEVVDAGQAEDAAAGPVILFQFDQIIFPSDQIQMKFVSFG